MAGRWWALFSVALLLGSSPTLAAELQVGQPHAVDPGVAWVPGYSKPIAVESDGEDWLVLSVVPDDAPGGQQLVATRVSADGVTLDQPGLMIASAPIEDAALSFDGTHYVVAWVEAASTGSASTIRVQRIATDGALVGTSVALGSVEQLFGHSLELASGAGSDLVLWCEGQAIEDPVTVCSWVQLEGAVVVSSDSMPFSPWASELKVASSGDSWLIAARSDDQVRLIRVGSDGLALDEQPVALASGEEPLIASADGGWVVLWSSGADLVSASVSFDGATTLGTTPVLDNQALDYAALERTADGYVVTGMPDGAASVAYFLDSDLSLTAEPQTIATGYGEIGIPIPSWGASSVLVAWQGSAFQTAPQFTFAKRLSAAGAVLDQTAFPIVTVSNGQSSPAAAYGPDAWLVVWNDNRSYHSGAVYAQRLDDSGSPLGQSAIRVAGSDTIWVEPTVAGSPGGWLAVWRNFDTVEAARVAADGTVLDSTPIHIGASLVAPSVAFDGTNWVVGWISAAPGDLEMGTARIVRIDPSGAFVDPESVAIAYVPLSPMDLDVDATGYLVSWNGISGSHVDFSGVPSGDLHFEGTLGSGRHELEYNDGDGWLFWFDDQLVFRSLGSNQAEQSFEQTSGRFDLVTVGEHGLAAWAQNSEVHLGLASVGGSLETNAVLSAATTSVSLAAKSADRALLTYAVGSDSSPLDARIFARVVDVSPSEGGEGGAPVNDGEGGTPGSGGVPGESGEAGQDSGGAPDTGDGGVPGAGNGGGEPGLESGGSASTGDGGASPKGDAGRSVSCACRAGRRSSGTTAALLTLLLGFVIRSRRRGSVPSAVRN